MDGRIDAHWHFVRIFIGNALIHLEEVAVALADGLHAQAVDGFGEVQIDAQAGRAHAAPSVADGLGVAAGHVARHKVAEARIAALQIVVALGLGNLIGRALVALLFGNPDAPIVAQRFAHQRQLRLIVAADGNAGGMNLCEARVGKERAALVRPPDGRGVRAFGVGGKKVDVAVAAGGQNHRIAQQRIDFAGHEVARYDAARLAVDHNQIEHLRAGQHRHRSGVDLALQSLIRSQQQLLAGLPARIKGARDLRAAKRAVGERSAVLARKGNALGHALIDDVAADLGQPVHIGLAGAEVAALDRVVEEAMHAVAVVLVVFGGVDAALRGNGVGAARRILKADAGHVIAQLAQRG